MVFVHSTETEDNLSQGSIPDSNPADILTID